MPENTPPNTPNPPPAAPAIDPFVAKVIGSMSMAMDETGSLKPVEPAKLDAPELTQATRPLSEIVVDTQDAREKAKQEGATPPPATPAPAPAPAPAAPPAQPATPPPAAAPAPTPPEEKVKVETPTSDKLKQQLEEMRQTPPPPPATPAPAPAPATPPPADPEAEYINTLMDEQKEELEFAEWAEKHGYPNQRKKTLDFFRQVDKFYTENPESTPDTDEFKSFVAKHKPAYSNTRKLEREFLQESITAKSKAETEELVRKQMDDLRRRTEAIELKPKIEAAMNSFESLLDSPEKLPLSQDVTPIPLDASETIRVRGATQSIEEFPIETRLREAAKGRAREYMNIVNNLTRFDPERNPTHRWIGDFVERQEQTLASVPPQQRMRDGKTFLPSGEFARLCQSNPAEASRHWTFTDVDMMDMFAMNAHLEYSREIQMLTKAGFVRQTKNPKVESKATPPPPQTGTAPATPSAQTTGSPRGGSSSMPGAAMTTPAGSPNAEFLERLMPGASKIVGG
jgi:hypothetical protein